MSVFSGMQYVYEVYKEKSFTKAAQNLFIAQPSLSATIKKIESKIGAPIFDRSTNPVHLTEIGEAYVKCATQIMDIENNFSDYLGNLETLKTGRITIGGGQFFVAFVIPSIIASYKRQYPLVDVALVEASSALLEEQLFNGTLDVVIDSNKLKESIYSRVLFRDESLMLAVPARFETNALVKAHQLTARDVIEKKHISDAYAPVPIKTFENDPFILLSPGNDSRKRADRLFLAEGIMPKTLLQLEQQFTAYNLAAAGMGISFVSDTLILRVPPDENLVFYKLPDIYARQSLYCYYKKNKFVTRAMAKFMEAAVEQFL